MLCEIFMFVLQLMGLHYYFKYHKVFKSMSSKDLLLCVFVKNFENKSLYDSDEEDVQGIGSAQMQKQMHDGNRIAIESHKKRLREFSKKFARNYLDCKFFLKQNKMFYMLTLLLQLLAAMSFNGVFDLPALLCILILMSLYALRKSFLKGYHLYTFFIAYFIHFSVFLKLISIILFDIDFVEDWMDDNNDSKYVKAAKILFGHQFTKEEDDNSVQQAKQVMERSILLACIVMA